MADDSGERAPDDCAPAAAAAGGEDPPRGPPRDPIAIAREAIAELRPRLMLTATRLCGNTADAEELVHDVAARVCERGIAADVQRPDSWLAKMLTNLYYDRYRAAARRPPCEPLAEQHIDALDNVTPIFGDVPEPSWQHLTLQDIRDALEEINPDLADIYRMHSFERMNYDQIAARLGIKKKTTIGTRLFRARQRLRKVLVTKGGRTP